jgi:hypothetical protein
MSITKKHYTNAFFSSLVCAAGLLCGPSLHADILTQNSETQFLIGNFELSKNQSLLGWMFDSEQDSAGAPKEQLVISGFSQPNFDTAGYSFSDDVLSFEAGLMLSRFQENRPLRRYIAGGIQIGEDQYFSNALTSETWNDSALNVYGVAGLEYSFTPRLGLFSEYSYSFDTSVSSSFRNAPDDEYRLETGLKLKF